MNPQEFHLMVSFFDTAVILALVAGICFGYFLARYVHDRKPGAPADAPKSCCSR